VLATRKEGFRAPRKSVEVASAATGHSESIVCVDCGCESCLDNIFKSVDTTNILLDRGHRKERVGTVVSVKNSKTIIVETSTRVPHPKFGKIVKQVKRFHAHDEGGNARLGDTVRIMESRPLSRLKRWRFIEVISNK
jgi:small subunit ribosomal protein S17